MSVGLASGAGGKFLGRNASFNPTTNWSISFWARFPVAPAAGEFINTRLAYGDPAFVNPYVDFFMDDSQRVAVELWDGAVSVNTGLQATNTNWNFYVIQYNAATTTLTLLRGDIDSVAASIGSVVKDLSTFVFVETKEQLLGDTTYPAVNNNLAYDRVWQRLLSAGEIENERTSSSAVLATNLIADTPLDDNTDLTDDSGNGHTWTATGAIVSFASPFYSSTTLPYNITLDANIDGVTQDVWFIFTAPFTGVIGTWFFGDLTTYKVRTTVFSPNATTVYLGLNGGAFTENLRMQIPVTAGVTYWFKASPSAGSVSPAILSIDIERAPTSPFQAGDLLVNDDSSNRPAVVLDLSADHTIRTALFPFPNGEAADILPSGISLWEDFLHSEIVEFAADLTTEITRFNPAGGSERIRACRGGNMFYVGRQTSPAKFFTVTPGGSVSGDTSLPVNGMAALAANNSQTILYWAQNNLNTAVRRWDITGGSALSDLVGGTGANDLVSDILYLADDTIVVLTSETVGLTATARRYDTSGTLLNTYSFGVTAFPAGTRPRLAYANDDPNSFFVWTHQRIAGVTQGISEFRNVKCSDGSILIDRLYVEYELSVYNAAVTATPLGKFGPSFSCPFVQLPVTSGLGTIIVNKVTIPSDTTLFDINTVNLSPSTYQLADGDSMTHSGLTPASNYEVSESSNALYDTVISVSNGSPANAISVAAGETVTVTITNTLKSAATGKITVGKVTNPFNPTQPFSFTAGGGLSPTSFTLHSEESIDFNVVPGSGYSIAEILPPGFTLHYMVSNDVNNDVSNITVGNGEHVTVMVLDESFGGGLFFPEPTFPGGNFPPGTGRTSDRVPGIPSDADVVIPNVFVETAFIRDL